MTITDYLINAIFVLVVLRQAHERRLDLRSIVVPLGIVLFVAHIYIHSIPTAGNDLVLVGTQATIGIGLGVAGGFATHVRLDPAGMPLARVGRLAGALLIGGISSRLLFGDRPRSRSVRPQLQHRASDRGGRLAGGARGDGPVRSDHPHPGRAHPGTTVDGRLGVRCNGRRCRGVILRRTA